MPCVSLPSCRIISCFRPSLVQASTTPTRDELNKTLPRIVSPTGSPRPPPAIEVEAALKSPQCLTDIRESKMRKEATSAILGGGINWTQYLDEARDNLFLAKRPEPTDHLPVITTAGCARSTAQTALPNPINPPISAAAAAVQAVELSQRERALARARAKHSPPSPTRRIAAPTSGRASLRDIEAATWSTSVLECLKPAAYAAELARPGAVPNSRAMAEAQLLADQRRSRQELCASLEARKARSIHQAQVLEVSDHSPPAIYVDRMRTTLPRMLSY